MWTVIAGLLLLPLIAMRFTDEVEWGGEDFAAAAILLAGTGLGLELVFRVTSSRVHRAALGAAIIGAAGLVWADAAVGLF